MVSSSFGSGNVLLRWRNKVFRTRFWSEYVHAKHDTCDLISSSFIGATQLNSSLLTISVIAVLLPAAFHFAVSTITDTQEASEILDLSHGVSSSHCIR